MAPTAPSKSLSLRDPSLAWEVLPGTGLCIVVAGVAYLLEATERSIMGRSWLEALVLAIVLGTSVRSVWNPADRWQPGIAFSAKYPLEIAVLLLGASVSSATILSAGPSLLLGIAAVVATTIPLSFGIGRCLGLPTRMALLIACGNSICGNSAIAAVAPVIGADGDDVASSIAFTAVLGVVVVLGLPLCGMMLDMTGARYGAFAGLTVYAVPQVIAAAAPFGAAAVQMGTLVKLVRVPMLGPVCLVLSFLAPRLAADPVPIGEVVAGGGAGRRWPSLFHMVPWFIIGFVSMVAGRSVGLVPIAIVPTLDRLATALTVISMAALGLGVDPRTVAAAGARVTATVVLSLATLAVISLEMLAALRVG